jgi:hypothetical protein
VQAASRFVPQTENQLNISSLLLHSLSEASLCLSAFSHENRSFVTLKKKREVLEQEIEKNPLTA